MAERGLSHCTKATCRLRFTPAASIR
jgi:hypothetical protein